MSVQRLSRCKPDTTAKQTTQPPPRWLFFDMTKRYRPKLHYSLMHELMASATQPMPAQHQRHQITRMSWALNEMMTAPSPGVEAWRILSDAVNLLETLVLCGEAPVKDASGKTVGSHWRGCDGEPVEIADASGLLQDAIAAMCRAGDRLAQGKPMRLDGPGLAAVRAVLEDYQAALEALPARTMVRCHRDTERRLQKFYGSIDHLPDGVHVMAI